MVDKLSISLTVHPDIDIPYTRTSTVEQEVVIGTVAMDHLTGDFYGDAMRGDAGDDWLRGLEGDDYISGGNGNDWLFGGPGKDILVGGPGDDKLMGGDDADIFLITSLGDLNECDHILDFMHSEGDKIDLSGIDAIVGSGNDAFNLVPSFEGIPGELVVLTLADEMAVVEGDVDGNGNADFYILVTTSTPLVMEDFVL